MNEDIPKPPLPVQDPNPEVKNLIPVVSVDEIIPGVNKDGLLSPSELSEQENCHDDVEVAKMENQGSALANPQSYIDFVGVEEIDKLKEVFHGQVVIDLGAGRFIGSYERISKSGAKAYVAVEPFFYSELLGSLRRKNLELSQDPSLAPPQIPFCVVAEDMLTFLRRLPDNSVSIFASGIDKHIIRDPDYKKAVSREIRRVTSHDGAVVSNYSGMAVLPHWDFFGEGESDFDYDEGFGSDDLDEFVVFRRKKRGLDY